jgi:hypothetical protein
MNIRVDILSLETRTYIYINMPFPSREDTLAARLGESNFLCDATFCLIV